MKVYSLRFICVDHYVYQRLLDVYSSKDNAINAAEKYDHTLDIKYEIDNTDGNLYLLITEHEL